MVIIVSLCQWTTYWDRSVTNSDCPESRVSYWSVHKAPRSYSHQFSRVLSLGCIGGVLPRLYLGGEWWYRNDNNCWTVKWTWRPTRWRTAMIVEIGLLLSLWALYVGRLMKISGCELCSTNVGIYWMLHPVTWLQHSERHGCHMVVFCLLGTRCNNVDPFVCPHWRGFNIVKKMSCAPK